MAEIKLISNAVDVTGLSGKIGTLCYKYMRDVKHAQTDIERLRKQVTELENASNSARKLLDGPGGARLKASHQLQAAMDDSQAQLQEIYTTLTPKKTRQAMSRFGVQSLKWPFQSREVERILQDLRISTQNIQLAMQVDQIDILLDIDKKLVISSLPVVVGAAFDSRAEDQLCLPTTRVELLRVIEAWVEDPQGQPIFYLSGMAGTGKSTIARTVAQSLAVSKALGASFFFKRGETDRTGLSKFFTTIAADLIARYGPFASKLKHALDTDSSITTKNAREQFEKLILAPLTTIPKEAEKHRDRVIVIDALDECEAEDEVELLLELLTRPNSLRSASLRVFVTSRPTLAMQSGLSGMEEIYQSYLLQEMPKAMIERDISTFMNFKLTKIREKFNTSVPRHRQLSPIWPEPVDFDTLVEMAVPLFIFADTVCRFISDRRCGSPDSQLKKVLSYKTKSQQSKLDATYLPILEQLTAGLSHQQTTSVLQEFREIVGPIVVLASPLSTEALGQLLTISIESIETRLDLLHSVLSIPESTTVPVKLLHVSFRDFLVDPDKRGRSSFWIDEMSTHSNLVSNCLRILNALEQDVCHLRTPGQPRLSVDQQVIEDKLSPVMQYAAMYWSYHARETGKPISDDGEVHKFLLEHFLHWLEVLSLLGRISESLGMLERLKSNVDQETGPELLKFLEDAIRFVRTNVSVIDMGPLQLYSSALAFAPSNSLIRTRFQGKLAPWLRLPPLVPSDWSQCLLTCEGHDGWLNGVAFSQDDKLLVSASDDNTLKIWRSDTGDCLRTLDLHTDWVKCVAFSHHKQLIASGGKDKIVRIWNPDTGECIKTLEGHTDSVVSLSFSSNGGLLATASRDNTTRLWDVETGTCKAILSGHSDWCRSVSLSRTKDIVATGSVDKSVRIWDLDGKCVRVVEGIHTGWIRSVALSHDATMVASGSRDKTIVLTRVDTGETIRVFHGHKDSVNAVALSPDNSLLASASADRTIWLWNTFTGEHIQTLQGHSEWVSSVVFSNDGKYVASSSDDKTVKVWRIDAAKKIEQPVQHNDVVKALCISEDATLAASASGDTTVKIWSVESGHCLQELVGHKKQVQEIAFSSDARLLVSSSRDQTIRIWDTKTAECVKELPGYSDWFNALAISVDGKLVGAASGRIIRVLNTATSECLHTFQSQLPIGRDLNSSAASDWTSLQNEGMANDLPMPKLEELALERQEHNDVRSFVFSNDGSLVACIIGSRTTRIWSMHTGELVHTLTGHEGMVHCVVFSHAARYIATGSADRQIKIWRTDTGENTQNLAGFGGSVTAVAFSLDAKLLASLSNDGSLCVHNVESGVYILKSDVGSSEVLAFSPDADLVAYSLKGHVRVMNVKSGTILHDFCDEDVRANTLAFSELSNTLFSASPQGHARIYDLEAGVVLQNLNYQKTIRFARFTEKSSSVVIACEDGTVQFWSVSTGVCTKTIQAPSPMKSSPLAWSPNADLHASVSEYGVLQIQRVADGTCTQTLEGTDHDFKKLSFAHQDRHIVAATSHSSVLAWDTQTGEAVVQPERHHSLVESAISGDEHVQLQNAALPSVSNHTLSVDLARRTSANLLTEFKAHPGSPGFGVSSDGRWITFNDSNLFQLPADSRPCCAAVLGSVVVIGCLTGRVIIVRLAESLVPSEKL